MKFGNYELSVVSDGHYRLDGGAMFGVVPKVLWEKHHEADDKNRIVIALNCLLLRGEGRVILVDTGMGHGWSEKEISIYGLERPDGDLVDDLARHGVAPEDITDVILTHLHFDHAGGAVWLADEDPRPCYPNATYWLQKQNLSWGDQPTERDRASYRRERWDVLLEKEGMLKQVDGNCEFLPGIRSIVVNGHTPGQQLVLIGDHESDRLLYCGDLFPFASQIRLPWIMSFDLNPLITLKEKRELLVRAATEDWVLAFEHDPKVVAARVRGEDGKFTVVEELSL